MHIASRLCLLLLFIHCAAPAHPLDIAYLQLRVEEGHLSATLDVHPNVAAGLVHRDANALVDEKIVPLSGELLNASLFDSVLTSDRGACTWQAPAARNMPQSVRLTAQAQCPEGWKTIDWQLAFLRRLPRTYQVLGRAQLGDDELVFTAQASNDRVHLVGQSAPDFPRFIKMGVEHIGASPSEWRTASGGWKLPDGIDHILFLLGLILGGGTLMQMLATVTGFTLGHSVTLALALLGWVHISPRIVEPAIALTIAFVAAESFFLARTPKARWKTAAVFGLIHGLGFASALGQLHIDGIGNFLRTLVGFNVGIEIGQAIFVAALAPLVLALRKREFFLKYGLRFCSLAISGTGIYWFFVRAFA